MLLMLAWTTLTLNHKAKGRSGEYVISVQLATGGSNSAQQDQRHELSSVHRLQSVQAQLLDYQGS